MQIIATYHVPKDQLEERLKASKTSRADFEHRVKIALLEAADNILATTILISTKITD